MTVNAEGYFPVEMNFDFLMVLQTRTSKETRLVVPLIKIPDKAKDTAINDGAGAEVSAEIEPVNDGAPSQSGLATE